MENGLFFVGVFGLHRSPRFKAVPSSTKIHVDDPTKGKSHFIFYGVFYPKAQKGKKGSPAFDDCFTKTVAESGFFSLYRGLTALLLGSMAECASLFVSYGYVKKALGVDEEAAGDFLAKIDLV